MSVETGHIPEFNIWSIQANIQEVARCQSREVPRVSDSLGFYAYLIHRQNLKT